jgi:hypothetical protein
MINVMMKITFRPKIITVFIVAPSTRYKAKTLMQPGPDKYYPENQQML